MSERSFRTNMVAPFLSKLKDTAFFPIQQVAILGDADYILCIRGDFVWLELKKLRGELRKIQLYKAGQVKKSGGIAIEANPGNWDKVKRKLLKLSGGYK